MLFIPLFCELVDVSCCFEAGTSRCGGVSNSHVQDIIDASKALLEGISISYVTQYNICIVHNFLQGGSHWDLGDQIRAIQTKSGLF